MASVTPRGALRIPALLASALAACETITSPPPPLSARLATTAVWSGGEALLVSSAFRPPAALPRVRIGADTLTVRRIDDSTVAVQLPDGDGPRVLTVEAPGFEALATTVVLYGFRVAEDGPFLTGFLQRLPGGPRVLGAGDPGPVEVNVRTGAVLRQWPDTVHSPDCTWGVGPSVRPDHYVLFGKTAGRCAHPWVWRWSVLSPGLVRVDSVWGRQDTWSFAEIGPGGSLGGSDDELYISRCDTAGCGAPQPYFNHGGALTGVTMAPTTQRAILHSWFGFVVDAATGDTLYRLSQYGGAPYYHIEGAAFSSGDDTVYAIGWGGQGSRLVMVDLATGALLDSLVISGVTVFDIASDPVRPWLYVAAFAGTNTTGVVPQLVVLEQGTLAPLAVLRAPATESLSLTQWHQFRLVLDPAADAVYVVATVQVYDAHGLRAKILRFGVLP